MMVDINDELFFQVDHTRAIDVGTLDDEDRIILSVNPRRDAHRFRAGELLICVRHGVAHDDFDFLVERAQQPEEAERRAEAVAIGAYVRSDREATLRLDQFDDLT